MAIGDNEKKSGENNDAGFGEKGYYDGFGKDPEAQGRASEARYRKMSRLDAPAGASIAGMHQGRGSVDENMEPDVAIGKQVEMEEGNAIKYRTCSWQKV